MKRTLSILAFASLGAIALSTTASWKVFQTKYNIQSGSKIHEASCLNCHTTKKGKILNPYGKELQVVMKAAGTKKLTPDFLANVEGLDALKDGQTNISRIKADRDPGQ